MTETFGIHEAYIVASAVIAVLLGVVILMLRFYMADLRKHIISVEVDLRKHIISVATQVRDVEVDIYKDFVQKKDIEPILERIENKIDKIYQSKME